MMRVPAVVFEWLSFRRSVTLAIVVLGGFAVYLYRLHRLYGIDHPDVVVSAGLAAAPFVGLLLAPALIGIAFGYVGWVDERIWTPWQGTYHAFDDHQIRVVETRGALWFASADVHAALGLRRRDGVLRAMRPAERLDDPDVGELLSNAGLVRLLGRSTDRRTLRLLSWAERDVRRIWQKKRDGMAASPSSPSSSSSRGDVRP